MNNILFFCSEKIAKQFYYLTILTLFLLGTTSFSRSQTVAFNTRVGVSNNSSIPSNDGNKKTKHSKSVPTVTITDASNRDTLCAGSNNSQTFTANVTGGTSPYFYFWSTNSGVLTSTDNISKTVSYYWATPTTDTVKLILIDSNNPRDTIRTSLVITVVYCADFAASTYRVCLDTCVYFYDLSSGNPNQWWWTFGNSNADATVNNTTLNTYYANTDTTNDSVFCVKFHTPGWQKVKLEIKNASGFDTSTTKLQYIFVGACPNASYTSTKPINDTVCNCKCIQFTKNSITDPFSQTQKWWFTTSTGAIYDTTREKNPLICFTTPGTYHISLVDYNSVGKDSIGDDSIVVIQCLKPSANIAIIHNLDSLCNCYAICSGECIKFQDSSCNVPTKWLWEFPGGSPSTDSTKTPPEICYFNTGSSPVTYTIKMVDTNAFGFDSAYTTITVKPNPIINLSAHPDGIINGVITIINGTTVTIDESGNDPFTYYWSIDPNTYKHPDSLSCDTCLSPNNPTANPTTSGWYYVHTVGANGCVQNDSVYVRVVKTSDIYVPNAFSPNGDGKDDYLFVRSNFIKTLYFAVYDRWGEKVWETTDQNSGWDGTFKGEPENNGVFGWYLKATLYSGKLVTQKGNVTLMR